MFTTLNLLLSICIPAAAGYVCLSLFFPRKYFSLCLKCALGYGLGFGLLAMWMLSLYVLGIPFSLWLLKIPFLIFIAAYILFTVFVQKSFKPQTNGLCIQTKRDVPRGRTENILRIIFTALLLLYIFLNMFYVFWRATTFPISSWDAIATVAFKAKIFFFDQTPLLKNLPHKTYPLFTPFMLSWVAYNLGHWSDLWIKIVFPFAFLSYTIIHYKFLGHFTNRTWALLGTAILLSSNFFIHHATIAYRDFFLMYFNGITIMLLLFWSEQKKSGLLILAALFAGFGTFTKLEGTAFLGIYLILFGLLNFPSKILSMKEKLINTFRFCLPSFGISLIYHIYKIFHHVLKEGQGTMDKTDLNLTWEKICLIPQIMTSFLQNLLFSGNWNIIWLVAFLSLIHVKKKWQDIRVRSILLSLVLFFGLYIGMAVATKSYVWIAGAQSVTTLSRLILHFFPLSVLLIILLNYSDA